MNMKYYIFVCVHCDLKYTLFNFKKVFKTMVFCRYIDKNYQHFNLCDLGIRILLTFALVRVVRGD